MWRANLAFHQLEVPVMVSGYCRKWRREVHPQAMVTGTVIHPGLDIDTRHAARQADMGGDGQHDLLLRAGLPVRRQDQGCAQYEFQIQRLLDRVVRQADALKLRGRHPVRGGRGVVVFIAAVTASRKRFRPW